MDMDELIDEVMRAAQFPRADTEPYPVAVKAKPGVHSWYGTVCDACGLLKQVRPLPNGYPETFYQWPGGILYERCPPCDPSRKPVKR